MLKNIGAYVAQVRAKEALKQKFWGVRWFGAKDSQHQTSCILVVMWMVIKGKHKYMEALEIEQKWGKGSI